MVLRHPCKGTSYYGLVLGHAQRINDWNARVTVYRGGTQEPPKFSTAMSARKSYGSFDLRIFKGNARLPVTSFSKKQENENHDRAYMFYIKKENRVM